MKAYLFSILVVCTLAAYGQPKFLAPNQGQLNRTMPIFVGKKFGTSFLASRNNNLYLITAKHLLPEKFKNGDTLNFSVLLLSQMKQLKAPVYLHSNDSVDVAVIRVGGPNEVGNIPPVDGKVEYYLSQDVLFFGFPLGFFSRVEKTTIPLVKHGIVSGWLDFGSLRLILLDGHNNGGFSGGPVYVKTNSELKIIGVVSGYYNEVKEMEMEKTDTGLKMDYAEKLKLQENSGIIIVYGTEYIEQIFTANGQ